MTERPQEESRAAGEPRGKRRRFIASGPHLLFEIVVVFVGILGAFWVEGYREDRQAYERATRILEVVSFELNDSRAWWAAWHDSISEGRESWQARYDEGEQLAPYFFRVPGAEVPSSTAWELALASSALEVLDPYLLRGIGLLYSEKAGVGERIARYQAQTEATVFPLLTGGVEAFFDPATAKHRTAFSANMMLMDEVLAEIEEMFDRRQLLMIEEVEATLDQMR